MKVLRHNQPGFSRALDRALESSSLFDPAIEQRVRKTIDAVRNRGDRALIELARKYDGVRLTPRQLRVEPTSVRLSSNRGKGSVGAEQISALRRAIDDAKRNVAAFAKRSLRWDWRMRNTEGGWIGEKFDPIQRVGIYVPGGTAPLVSTAIMTITLAQVAGCPEIVVCTPSTDPSLLYAARLAGATEIYRVGGAQAIAAMALGTKTIRRVNKIYGPGNAYVTAAKRLLFGIVGIDMLSGPSELLVLADDTADPRLIAADMLAQAEHGSGYERVWLVTTSERVLKETPKAASPLTETATRAAFIRRAIERNCVMILARDLKQGIDITNRFAPEHCELMTSDNRRVLRQIKTAGAVFIGPWSPTVVGDYVAGPSHALPTGGAGAFFAGLTVDQFQHRTSVIEYSRDALRKSLRAIEAFGQVEGLDAHVQSARIRFS